MQPPRVSKSLLAGLIFIGLALLFGASTLSLTLGTAARMGPGYFPLLLAVVLGVLGVVVSLEGFAADSEVSGSSSLRSVLLVAGSVVTFALTVESLGLVPAVALTSFLFSLADRQVKLPSAAATAVVLALFSWLLFDVALTMSWPAFGTVFG
jgi:putative tricarboxylic transport membrane protein